MNATDLFIVGIGFDLSGAVLLAWGLLASPEDMVRFDMTFWGMSGSIGRSIKDKVLGGIGVCYLVVGFLLQGVAYMLALADGTSVTRGSTRQAWIAAGVGVAAIAVSAGIARLAYPRLVKWQGRRAARVAVFNTGFADAGPYRAAPPNGIEPGRSSTGPPTGNPERAPIAHDSIG